MRSSDPLLTASLYSWAPLDEAVQDVLAPFWKNVRELDTERECALWWIRYSRGGPHLKIRIHGPAAYEKVFRGLLEERARPISPSPGAPAGDKPRQRSILPPLDSEDYISQERPSGTLAWTRCRRSDVLFGPEPLLSDDRYIALFVDCLGAGCEHLLDEGPARRRSALLEILSTGLAAALPDPEERLAYLSYHRDWTVRFPVLKAGRGIKKVENLLDRYDREADRLQAMPQALSGAVHSAFSALGDHLRRVDRGGEEKPIDPYVQGLRFPALLKVLHGIANAAGMDPINEGLLHHLLLRSADRERRRGPFLLLPASWADHPDPSIPDDAPPHWSAFDFDEKVRWWELLTEGDAKARRWVESYAPLTDEIVRHLVEAVSRMRAGKPEEGYTLLEQGDRLRRSLLPNEPSMFAVMSRFYFSSYAYFLFLAGEAERAERAMEESRSAITQAIEIDRFLYPFAMGSLDVPLKLATIACQQRRWEAMQGHLLEYREMGTSRKPLCVLSDGTEIRCADVIRDFAALPLSDERRSELRVLLEENLWHWEIQRLVARCYALPGQLIPQP